MRGERKLPQQTQQVHGKSAKSRKLQRIQRRAICFVYKIKHFVKFVSEDMDVAKNRNEAEGTEEAVTAISLQCDFVLFRSFLYSISHFRSI